MPVTSVVENALGLLFQKNTPSPIPNEGFSTCQTSSVQAPDLGSLKARSTDARLPCTLDGLIRHAMLIPVLEAAEMDPRYYAHSVKLKNGVAITLRAIRPDDRERLRTAFGHLDPGTIYTRFFGAKRELSEAELTAATAIDFDAVVALVAVLNDDPETIIGGGRYVRSPGSGSPDAEVAFTVEEDYQGLGIASLMLRELSDIAKAAGVTRVVAEVLPQNAAMLRVFRNSGKRVTASSEDGVVKVTIQL